MAFLSASLPWQALVSSQADQLEQQVATEHPDLAGLVIGVRCGELVVVAHAGDSDPERTAWRIAGVLAPYWPGFLIDMEAGLRVVSGSVAISVDADAMDPPPATQGQEAWLARSTISLI